MQVPEERYNILMSRYDEFVEGMGNPDIAPVKVFDALSQKQNEELLLIREISAYLQKKKDDDIAKQNQTETEETAEKEETKEGSEEETKEGSEEETKEESEKQKSQ
ncbi:unnamed protein product [Pieris macdunnoughi]|uniref:Uncharacterized protein n=1 Tax=Pieris macdunnoughi TaxID=345717 RepID=A0A821YB52_9NEOP|nr:unnamed protein product [Pieris macdunnoughi]